MEDGVYGFQMDECYYTKKDEPYILIELSESRTITQIALRTQVTGTSGDKFHNTIVRVGDIEPFVGDIEPIVKDFSALSYFGKYDTGFPGYDMDVIIENAAGVTGKYISIQEKPDRTHTLQVCAIEITGF